MTFLFFLIISIFHFLFLPYFLDIHLIVVKETLSLASS